MTVGLDPARLGLTGPRRAHPRPLGGGRAGAGGVSTRPARPSRSLAGAPTALGEAEPVPVGLVPGPPRSGRPGLAAPPAARGGQHGGR